jgi:arylformamidase
MRTGPRLSRRQVLKAACAFGVSQRVFAQQRMGPPPHERGPNVFLNYDQVELDAAYDQAAYASNRSQVAERSRRNSDLTRARIGQPRRFAYGSSEIEKLDVFAGNRPLGGRRMFAPIQIHIHGGAWRGGAAQGNAYLAEPFVEAGAAFVIPDFAPVQDVGGLLMPMAEQVRRSIAWVYKNAASFHGDPNRIYLSGHSSGAHLAGCALIADWPGEHAVPADIIKGALLVSGMYDLRGPRLSSRREYVKFDDATEDALSAQRHIDRIRTPLIVAYASLDTPEFQRQSREFAAAVKAAGKPVEFIEGEGYNHFEFIETLGNPYGILGRAALRQLASTQVQFDDSLIPSAPSKN